MTRARRAFLALVLGLVGLGLAAPAVAVDRDPVDITVRVTIPDDGGPVQVDDAVLRWGLTHEAGGGAFAGGCNFLSAGLAGDTGGVSVWTEADGFYRATDGAVRIERPLADGTFVPATFATRCLGPDGSPVTTSSMAGSGAEVVIDGGTGTVDRSTGTATIAWEGSFTAVFYGGMTYWSASDPVLDVKADGTGTLTATASGYGTSMEDMTQWEELPPTPVVLADLSGVSLADEAGFSVLPDYLNVAVSGAGIDQRPRTTANAAYWGAFPQSFVEFQVLTGQAAYWYTSGGARDQAKLPLPVSVSYDASRPVDRPDGGAIPPSTPSGPGPVNQVTPPPGGTRPAPPAPVAALAAAGAGSDVVPASWPMPLGGSTVLPATSFIPPVVAGMFDEPRERLLWSLGGVLGLASFGVLGLVKGWLVLPWIK